MRIFFLSLTILDFMKRFVRNERGASLVEYGILVGLVTAAVVGIIAAIGVDITARFQAVLTALQGSPQP